MERGGVIVTNNDNHFLSISSAWPQEPIMCQFLPSATKLCRLCFYTCLSFCPQERLWAIPACIAGGIPACLAAGGSAAGGPPPEGDACYGGACSSGGPLQGGCLLSRGLPAAPGVCGDPPESRRLMLQTVCILLECILVWNFNLHWYLWGISSHGSEQDLKGTDSLDPCCLPYSVCCLI